MTMEIPGLTDTDTEATVVGCSACGTRAKAKDRRWVGLRHG